jgi:hypothetical protein
MLSLICMYTDKRQASCRAEHVLQQRRVERQLFVCCDHRKLTIDRVEQSSQSTNKAEIQETSSNPVTSQVLDFQCEEIGK